MRLLLTMALLLGAVSAASLRACDRRCGDAIALQCASDGVTYANECLLHVAQCKDASLRVVSKGACAEDADASEAMERYGDSCARACTREYMPVCGSNRVTYSNMCMFRNAQRCRYRGGLRVVKRDAC